MTGIFDSHAHYNDSQFDTDRDSLISSIESNGVCGVINCATDYNSSVVSVEYAHKYPNFYAACGIHPEDIQSDWAVQLERIVPLLSDSKCAAVGEIGLDYHYDGIPKDIQHEVFCAQLKIAQEHSLPVIIHDREAHADTLDIIKEYKPRGVLHCFSGSPETAREVLKLGMYLGFGGGVTFKNAVKCVETVRIMPLDRLLLETDCPYMAPVPFRGKRNDSSLISYTAQKIAEIRGMDAQDIINIAAANTKKLFNIK